MSDIQRFHVGVRLSEMAVHNGTVYLAGQVPDDPTKDLSGQTAEVLAGCGCRLTLVEMLPSVGPGMYETVVADVMGRIVPHNPKVLTGHRLERVRPDGVELTRLEDGKKVFVEADAVVLAMGVRPRKAVVDEFKAAFPNVRIVGDAARGGRILEATKEVPRRLSHPSRRTIGLRVPAHQVLHDLLEAEWERLEPSPRGTRRD